MFEWNSLDRFRLAQKSGYQQALREIRLGQKQSHWMWYIFPQLRGLGLSMMSCFYGIRDLDEAKEYLADPVLGKNLNEISAILYNLPESNPVNILGTIDAVKLKSSMTLFAYADSDPDSIFVNILEKYFGGMQDLVTVELLISNNTGGNGK